MAVPASYGDRLRVGGPGHPHPRPPCTDGALLGAPAPACRGLPLVTGPGGRGAAGALLARDGGAIGALVHHARVGGGGGEPSPISEVLRQGRSAALVSGPGPQTTLRGRLGNAPPLIAGAHEAGSSSGRHLPVPSGASAARKGVLGWLRVPRMGRSRNRRLAQLSPAARARRSSPHRRWSTSSARSRSATWCLRRGRVAEPEAISPAVHHPAPATGAAHCLAADVLRPIRLRAGTPSRAVYSVLAFARLHNVP